MVLYQLASLADTVLVRNVPPVRSVFEQVVFVTSGLTSILVFVLIGMIVVGLLVLRSTATKVLEKLEELMVELKPMARNTAAMSDDVREMAKNVNRMVDESRDTVRVVNDRVRSSVVTLTDRVDEMSELIGRVNRSADRVASVATTAVAGIKLGARALGLGKGRKAKKKAPRAEAPERPRLRRRD
jgi:HAMP domain-containing protein